MDRLQQRFPRTAQEYQPFHRGLAGFLGISCLLFLPGCAQLDQLMGKQKNADGSVPQAQAAESAPVTPASENHPVQSAEPAAKPSPTKKTAESHSANVAKEPRQQSPSHPPAHPVAPAAGQDKALAENDQINKEKKSRVASDKKSKKSPKTQTEPQPPTEDVFLPPVPLPSKPASIGGSGG